MKATAASSLNQLSSNWRDAAAFDGSEEATWAEQQVFRVEARKHLILDGAGHLRKPLSHAFAAPGKCFRALLLLGHSAFSPNNDEPDDNMICAAAAIELLHDASLLHDDVVDHSTMRRGQSSVATAFTVRTAVHVGCYQAGAAIAMLARACDSAHITLDLSVLRTFAKGQIMEILPLAAEPKEQFARIATIVNAKTGTLLLMASQLGAQFAAITGGQGLCHKDMLAFSEALALAYQIHDDILDLELSDNLRRPGNNDMLQGTVNWPMALWIASQPRPASVLRHIRHGNITATAREQLRVDIVKSGVLDKARLTVKGLIDEATNILLSYPPSLGQRVLAKLLRGLLST